jgi:hypothetical protein
MKNTVTTAPDANLYFYTGSQAMHRTRYLYRTVAVPEPRVKRLTTHPTSFQGSVFCDARWSVSLLVSSSPRLTFSTLQRCDDKNLFTSYVSLPSKKYSRDEIRVHGQPEVGSQFAFRDARMQYVTDVKSCALGVEPLFTLGKDLACLLRANIVCDVNYDSRSHGNMLGLNY